MICRYCGDRVDNDPDPIRPSQQLPDACCECAAEILSGKLGPPPRHRIPGKQGNRNPVVADIKFHGEGYF